MSNSTKVVRLRRAKKTRAKIKNLRMPRLCVNRTPRHMYVQLISADGSHVIAAASTLGKSFKATGAKSTDVSAAKEIGKLIADRAKESGVIKVAFDRSGFKYHGRIKALAEAAREGGLEF